MLRRAIGYGRYDTPRQGNQRNALYAVYRLYVNHFLPVQKLVAKVREGSKVKKVYDAPQTPYPRVLDSPQVCAKAGRKLRVIHSKLDIVELKRQIDEMMVVLTPTKQG